MAGRNIYLRNRDCNELWRIIMAKNSREPNAKR